MGKNKFCIVNLPKFSDTRGSLSFVQQNSQIPFIIHRVYWIYDIPEESDWDGYSYKDNEELVIAMSGSFDVVINNGGETNIFKLNRSHYGIYIPKGTSWIMTNFSTNSLALVLSSVVNNAGYYAR